jgi:hypothetical protein
MDVLAVRSVTVFFTEPGLLARSDDAVGIAGVAACEGRQSWPGSKATYDGGSERPARV